jgi:hypothetical protein
MDIPCCPELAIIYLREIPTGFFDLSLIDLLQAKKV